MLGVGVFVVSSSSFGRRCFSVTAIWSPVMRQRQKVLAVR